VTARYVFDLAFEDVIYVAVIAHPSLLKIPDDLEVRLRLSSSAILSKLIASRIVQKYRTTAKAPLLINSCTTDNQFPPEAQAKADEILGGGKFAPGYVREYWEGCAHGFAVRGESRCLYMLSNVQKPTLSA
jgi:hypothetical protein